MSENDGTIQTPQTLTFEPLGYLANQSSTDDPDQPQQLETYANELLTNIIKDASKEASRNHDENFDNTNELNFPPTSKQNQSENTTTALDKSEYSTTNGIQHDGDDFNHEDIEKKMNDLIHDIQSHSGNDTNITRKSITSNHLHDDQVNNSTPTITDLSIQIDPISNNSSEGPIRSMSETALVDHHASNEQSLPLPIHQDESSSDADDIYGIKTEPINTTVPIDDFIDQNQSEQENRTNNRLDDNDDFFNMKTATIDDDQQSSNVIKQNNLDETTRFGTTSPTRVQSASSKRSVRVTPDEPSTSGDEKRTQVSPTKLPDDTDNDTDRDNQEVATIARRPSRALSPLDRPRSPTPNDSRKASIANEPPSPFLAEQSQTHLRKDDNTNHSPVLSDGNQQSEEQQKQSFESPTAIISTASRRESTNKSDQQQTSRPPSAIKTKVDDNSFEPSASRPDSSRTNNFIATDEQSKLVKPGEQLQIPIDDLDNERLNSPPPLSTDIKSIPLINPLLGSSLVQNEHNQSRPPSETNRKSPTTSMISNEKVIDGDVLPSKSRRESTISQQQTNITDQKSTSRHGSEVIEQTPQISSSRRASSSQQQDELDSHREQQVASRRTSNVPQEPTSPRRSSVTEQQTTSRRESITIEQKPSSTRKESTTSQEQASSKQESIAPEQQTSIRRESITVEQKTTSRNGSITSEQQTSTKRESFVSEQQPSHRRESTTDAPQVSSKRVSIASEQQISSPRGSTADDQKASSPHGSTTDEQNTSSRRPSTAAVQTISSPRGSTADEQKSSSRRGSTTDEQKSSSRRGSTSFEQKTPNRKESATFEQQEPSRRLSISSAEPASNRRESVADVQKTTKRKESTASEQETPSERVGLAPEQQKSSRRESTNDEPKVASRKASTNFEQQASSRRESTNGEQKTVSRKASTNFEQQASSKRESLAPEEQTSHRRQSSFDQQEQKSSSKPVSRKPSLVEQQQIASRRESQQQTSSSRRTSTNRDNQPSSPRRSTNIHTASSQESSRRSSVTKQEQQEQPTSILVNKDSRRSSLNINDTNRQQIKQKSHSSHKVASSPDTDDVPTRTSAKHNQERTSFTNKRQKSSTSTEENDNRRSSFQQRTGQESKRNTNFISDETIVTPIIMDSSKVRQLNGKRTSTTDSSYEQTSTSKLPEVNVSFQQEKLRRSDTLNKQQIPTSNRLKIKQISSSHATTPSEDEQTPHWTKQISVPSILLTDDDASSSRENQPRPKSPNAEQIAERNQSPSPPITTTSTIRKRSTADGQRRKEQLRLSRRSTSADSLTHIPLVDDRSLDSTSENNVDFARHKRRNTKPKRKDVETNTDQTFDSQQQRSFFDEKELSSQKPLKATKPMSDHLHSTRRRAPNKEQILTTPDTDTPTVRRTTKQTKDSNNDTDPVHVNVTVVVKKFAGTSKDEPSHTAAEAFVEQKSQQYFEPVQRPPEILPPPSSSATEIKENSEVSIERPKSTEQQQIKSPEQTLVEHSDRHTQSDTEQIITEQQKKRRRPKRISRTSQTYECVFRRMERDQQQDLRTTSDTEKNIQTRKSQLRPRKKSPRKNLPIYLSHDSFRLEEFLPKQYHQSRRNISKSSSIARSLSPQGGKLLILRPTLPFHHTDAVNVQRVCLQYAIDLVPNENLSSGTMGSHRNKLTILKQPEHTNSLPMISASSSGVNVPTNKSNTKEKSASYKSEDYTQHRKNGGAV